MRDKNNENILDVFLEKINTFTVSLKFSYKEILSQDIYTRYLPQSFIYRCFKIIFYNMELL